MLDAPPDSDLIAQMRTRLDNHETLNWESLTSDERAAVQVILDEARLAWSGDGG